MRTVLLTIAQIVLVLKNLAPLRDTELEKWFSSAARLCQAWALTRKRFNMAKDLLVAGGHDDEKCSLSNGVLVYGLAS